MRSRAGVSSGARRATAMAKQTIVSTPERPMRSARIQTPNVLMNCRMMALGTSRTLVHQPQDDPRQHADRRRCCRPRRAGSVGATAAERERVHRDRANGEPVDQQRGGVVQQALAFEDRQDAMRRPELPQDRRRRRGVGRRDDGAERDRRRPRHRRHERADHPRDGDRRQADADDDEARHRRPVVPQIARRGVVGRVQQDRRDEERQRQLRLEHELGRARHEREDRAAEREKRGIRRADPAGDGRQEDRHEQQAEERLEADHAGEIIWLRIALESSLTREQSDHNMSQ